LTSIVIEPQASLDIEEAASWYETQLIGLGVEFILEIDFAIEKIQNNPKLYLQSYRFARRALLRRFPYAIYYVFNHLEIRILAVLHQVRSDKTIKLRLL
jgi:plasmid stabilization system protein ParE